MEDSIQLTNNRESYNTLSLRGIEAISNPYRFSVSIVNVNQELLEQECFISLGSRKIYGVITKTQTRKALNPITICTVEPKLALSKNRCSNLVMVRTSLQDIITKLLTNCGYQTYQLKFALTKEHKIQELTVQQPNETDFDFLQRLTTQARIYYWFDGDDYEQVHFCDDENSPYLGKFDYDPFAKIPSFSDLTLQADSNIEKLILKGDIKTLISGHQIELDTKLFAPQYSSKYLITNIEHEFAQRIENIGITKPYRNMVTLSKSFIPIDLEPLFPGNHTAFIYGAGEAPYLDETGNYLMKYRFDLAETAELAASDFIPKLTPYGGWHMPLHNDSEVITNNIDGDTSNPIILGAIHNKNHQSPVTLENNHQHILRSKNNNQLLMDDKMGQEKISLNTKNQHNHIELNADEKNPKINITSTHGTINLRANNNINHISNKNITEDIQNSKAETAKQNYLLISKNSYLQAARNYDLKANNILYLQAEKIHKKSNNSNIKAKNINITANIISHKSNNSLKIVATKTAKIHSNKNIEFSASGSCMKITPTSIDILGSSLNFQGPVVVTSQPTSAMGPVASLADIPNPTPIKTAPRLKPGLQQNHDLLLKWQYNDAQHTPVSQLKYDLNAETLETDIDGLTYVDNESQTQFKLNSFNEIIKINNKNQQPWYHSDLTIPALKNQGIKPDNKHTITIETLFPPIIKNSRNNQQPRLSDLELQYFKNNPEPNATIFIHGFNIKDGHFGKQFKPARAGFEKLLYPAACEATTIRTLDTIKDYLPNATQPQLDEYKDLNGTANHAWLLHLEDNLNRATGQFERKNYDKYNRLIHIQWDGNPNLSVDYMRTPPIAINTGKNLVELAIQLITNKIKINIIAHSLGNAVLLSLLEEIGKHHQDAIENVFMWEAAVPNNVFSNTEGIWAFPHAANATKKITILFSNNDNVLGPIPPEQNNQNQINASKPVLDELIPAIIFTHLGFGSMYNLAMWLGEPITDLLDCYKQENYYYHIHSKYGDTSWPLNLDDMVKEMLQRHPQDFDNLKQKVTTAEIELNKQLKEAGHKNIATLIEIGEKIIRGWSWLQFVVPTSISATINSELRIAKQSFAKVAKRALTILLVMTHKVKYEPVPGLGYNGPGHNDPVVKKLMEQGKLNLPVDQTKWLWSHSGMKIPSKELMGNVYKAKIMTGPGGTGIKNFGRYAIKPHK